MMRWNKLPSLEGAIAVGVRRQHRMAFPVLLYVDGHTERLGDATDTRDPWKSAQWYARRLNLPLEKAGLGARELR